MFRIYKNGNETNLEFLRLDIAIMYIVYSEMFKNDNIDLVSTLTGEIVFSLNPKNDIYIAEAIKYVP